MTSTVQEVAPGRVRLAIPAARALAEAAVRSTGYAAAEAAVIAEHALDAALCGYEYSGLPKLLNIEEHHRHDLPRKPVAVLHETAVSARMDGGNNVGMLALSIAADKVIEKAAAHGIAVVGMNNAWTSGRSAHYVERVARAGLVAIHTASAARQVAPPGGAKGVMGTNPIAFAFPRDPDPLIIDMGTSAVMATDVKYRKRMGIPLPENAAVDAQGNVTRDAALASLGALLPFGGAAGAHKGFALALAVEAFGVLGGCAADLDQSYGYLFIAFRPDLLMPLAQYQSELEQSIQRIKATPRAPGVDEIRIPSERMYRERARHLAEGAIVIDRAIHDALEALIRRGPRAR